MSPFKEWRSVVLLNVLYFGFGFIWSFLMIRFKTAFLVDISLKWWLAWWEAVFSPWYYCKVNLYHCKSHIYWGFLHGRITSVPWYLKVFCERFLSQVHFYPLVDEDLGYLHTLMLIFSIIIMRAVKIIFLIPSFLLYYWFVFYYLGMFSFSSFIYQCGLVCSYFIQWDIFITIICLEA